MKIARICLVIVATLTFASIATAQCGPARPKTPTGTGSLDEMIIAQEKLVIEALKKGDSEAFKAIVDVNGTVVDSSGIKKVSDVLSMLFDPKLKFTEYTLEEPQVRSVDKNTAILHYKSKGAATMDGQTMSGTSYETTVYVRRVAKWIAVFHQTSEIPPPATTVAK